MNPLRNISTTWSLLHYIKKFRIWHNTDRASNTGNEGNVTGPKNSHTLQIKPLMMFQSVVYGINLAHGHGLLIHTGQFQQYEGSYNKKA